MVGESDGDNDGMNDGLDVLGVNDGLGVVQFALKITSTQYCEPRLYDVGKAFDALIV